MQRYDYPPSKSYNTTFALAQFLTTTGPEDYSNNRSSQYDNVAFDPQTSQSLQTNKMKFFDRLRKKTNNNHTKFYQQQQQQKSHQYHHQHPHPFHPHQNKKTSFPAYGSPSSPINHRGTVHKKHIPLIDDINQPNSQIINYHLHRQQEHPSFYETEDNHSFNNAVDTLPSFPTPPASSLHESEDNQQQQVSSPLFSSSSSSSISESSPAYSPAHITRSKTATVTVTPAYKKGIRRGSRHIQVQTDDDGMFSKKEEPSDLPSPDAQVTEIAVTEAETAAMVIQQRDQKDRCELCCRPLNQNYLNPRQRDRRISCPAALSSGAKIKLLGHEAGVLLALIDQLKQQLVEEQQSRKLLEKAIQSQWLEKTKTFA